MRIPINGLSKDDIFDQLTQYAESDMDRRADQSYGYVFSKNEELETLINRAYTSYLGKNGLDPTFYPSLLRLENEVVSMAAAHLNGNEQVVGNFTSGGTESILLACKAARDYYRATRPEITEPEMLIPWTGHAAFRKAAAYFGLKVVNLDVEPENHTVTPETVRAAITPNTILIIGSASNYAYGTVDPIRELGQIALERGLWLHVDGCIGGFLLPFFKKLGRTVTDFDFSVPGVSSMSMDYHKYAYAAKGASVVLYRDKGLRKYQIFTCADWAGYSMVNQTIQSSKSGGPLAAAWAVLNFLGEAGYLSLAQEVLTATETILEGIRSIPELRVMGTPQMSLIAFTSDEVNVFHLADEMRALGWYVQPQLKIANMKESLHLSVAPANAKKAPAMIEALRTAVAAAKKLAPSKIAGSITQMVQSIDPETLDDKMFAQLLAMAGLGGVGVPERYAEISEVMNVLPLEWRKALLKNYFNELFSG